MGLCRYLCGFFERWGSCVGREGVEGEGSYHPRNKREGFWEQDGRGTMKWQHGFRTAFEGGMQAGAEIRLSSARDVVEDFDLGI